MSLREFARLRFIRLYPVLVLGIAIGTLGYFNSYSVQFLFFNCLAALLFLPSPFSTEAEGFPAVPANPPEWTLCFEFFGNLFYGLVAPMLDNKALLWAIVIFFAWYEVSFWIFDGENSGFSWPTILGGVPRFGLSFGIGIAIMRLARIDSPKRWRAPWLFLSLVLLICFSISVPPQFLWLYSSFLVLIVFPAAVYYGSFARVTGTSAKLCIIAGELSYPLYILQGGFVPHVKILPQKLHLTGLHALALIVVCAGIYTIFVYAVWRALDAPIRRKLLLKSKITPDSGPAQSMT
jgi:peptidoglycan/LPS O-acetylase OafA/YrhL